MMEEVKNQYDFLEDIGSLTSVGTCSPQWMRNTFTEEQSKEMKKTLHVTANTHSDLCLKNQDFLHLEEVWSDGWDEELCTVPARKVTDRAVHYHRSFDSDRTIVHYMQPHPPFITPTGHTLLDPALNSLAQHHYEGDCSRKELWKAHIDNLKHVLDDVRLLLSNMSANKVVISADHGQAFDERRVWGHPASAGVDVVRKVPWCVTTASDNGEYIPSYEETDQSAQADTRTEEQLYHLGYL
jgi:hypothetical protein